MKSQYWHLCIESSENSGYPALESEADASALRVGEIIRRDPKKSTDKGIESETDIISEQRHLDMSIEKKPQRDIRDYLYRLRPAH